MSSLSVYLNSFDGTRTLPGNNATLTFDTPKVNTTRSYTSVKLDYATFLNQIQTIEPYNISLTFTENSIDYTITIPEGFYTAVSLAAEIALLMDAVSPFVHTGTVNPTTNLITFTSTPSNDGDNIRWDLPNSPWYTLGFNSVLTSWATGIMTGV